MKARFEEIFLDAKESFRLLQWNNNIRDVDIVHTGGMLEPMVGAGDAWHLHPQTELLLVKQGTGTWLVGDYIGTFESPQLMLFGSNLPHCFQTVKPSKGLVLQFAFDSDRGLWKSPEIESLRALCSRGSRGICFPKHIALSVEKKLMMISRCGSVSRLAHFLEIMGILVDVPNDKCELLSRKEFSIPSVSIHHKAIDRVIQYTIERYAENITLDDVLKVAHMSKPTFSRQFKRHTGKTFVDFLNEIRLDQVRHALLETEESISRIALESGFGNLSHFNRLFRRHFRLSPSEFRKSRARMK
ncbi:MAG: helix-turn-helix domain-containing protein [Pirellulales bacterium]|nr:helix-turn-helix domain-containing protein [Pirellulales bacterium]